ncbi:O-antigen ligase family protein [Mucilaginibacter sabulilitoris]|uniref:O-antigen ligase family protein n=1 Tax=Mucilaginibacter sabulilitoris TaxID=1173583 RepID=A0ABZ0TVY5_9SPHI|nr:O-antigen ligase family protein [Mucilaginibacter sabulilitoris]WPU95615.1 O-antigen ligase family protein [Mucilaginibacter sabulilitoris]
MTISFGVGNMNGNDFVYWISFVSLFASLFVLAAILSLQIQIKWIYRLFWSAVTSTIIGFILNYTNFQLFRDIGKLSGSTLAYVVYGSNDEGRIFSFFVHPNMAALSTVCFFVFLLTTSKEHVKKIRTYMLYLGLMIGMILVTGSRTSLIVIAIIAIIYLPKIIRRSLIRRHKFNNNLGNITIVFGGILIVLLFVFGIFVYISLSQSPIDTTGRLSFFFRIFNSSPTVSTQDDSLADRLKILDSYWKYIEKNLLFGLGPQFARDKLSNGEFENVSQNVYIENTLNYGIFYVLFYIYALVKTYQLSSKIGNFKDYIFNPLKVFVVLLTLIGFSINGLYTIRAVVILLGILIGLTLRGSLQKNMKSPQKALVNPSDEFSIVS